MATDTTTVEVRIPVPDTATGQTSRWCKVLRAVAERAKSGMDWDGEWADVGKLVDLEIGSLIVVGGSTGSRKYGVKTAQLYVVDPDGDLISIAYTASNEWAIKLRDTARRFLAMPSRQRPIEACRYRAEKCRKQEPSNREAIDRLQKVIEAGGYDVRQDGTVDRNHLYHGGGYTLEGHRMHGGDEAVQNAIAASLEKARKDLEARETEDRIETESNEAKAREWDERAERLAAALTPTESTEPTSKPIVSELTRYTTEELKRELQRRGCLLLD